MVGVLGMAWRSGRCSHEGYADLHVTVYWRHGGMRGGTGVRMVGVPRTRGGTGNRTAGVTRSRMAVLGCPPDPSNNSGGLQGHPLAPLTN